MDPDRAVVATCLDVTGGLTVLDPDTALVSERRTGRILPFTCFISTGSVVSQCSRSHAGSLIVSALVEIVR